jgi:hypothetical protein
VRRCRAPPPPRPARRRPARIRCRGAARQKTPRVPRRLHHHEALGQRRRRRIRRLGPRRRGPGRRSGRGRPSTTGASLPGRRTQSADVDERVASVLTETESGVRSSSCILSCTFRFVPVISAVLCEWLCSLCSFHPLSRRRSAGAPNFSLHLSCRDPECDHLIATMLLYLQVYCDGSYVRTSRH